MLRAVSLGEGWPTRVVALGKQPKWKWPAEVEIHNSLSFLSFPARAYQLNLTRSQGQRKLGYAVCKGQPSGTLQKGEKKEPIMILKKQ